MRKSALLIAVLMSAAFSTNVMAAAKHHRAAVVAAAPAPYQFGPSDPYYMKWRALGATVALIAVPVLMVPAIDGLDQPKAPAKKR
jgi:hypothetical protein